MRTIIAGKPNSGKTQYIKKCILPKLKNYFLIDINNEYHEISSSKKLVSHDKQEILEAINKHRAKTVLIEDLKCIGIRLEDLFILNLEKYIIVSQSASGLEKYIHGIDEILDFEHFSIKFYDNLARFNGKIKFMWIRFWIRELCFKSRISK